MAPVLPCCDQPNSPHLTAHEIRGGLFIGIGDHDQIQPVTAVQRFLDVVRQTAASEIRIFAGVDHGYSWPGWPGYNAAAAAAAASFEQAVALLHRHLAETG